MNGGKVQIATIPDGITTFAEEFDSDSENESRALLRFYKHGDAVTRKAVDWTLMYLCGWTLETLIEKAKERGNYINVEYGEPDE